MKPLLLDLFCGAGGATKGYQRAGFYVIGVDIHDQPNYCGDQFWKADALDFLGEGIDKFAPFNYVDAIHASPPCQAYSQRTPDQDQHVRLIDPLRNLLNVIRDEVPWVIENVVGARDEMQDPVMLCGSSFGLRVQRHRLFETNWGLEGKPCEHGWQEEDKRFLVYDHRKWFWTGVVPVYGSGGRKAVEYWPSAMGCGSTWDDCWMSRPELQEAIPPAFTEYIGHQLMEQVQSRRLAA